VHLTAALMIDFTALINPWIQLVEHISNVSPTHRHYIASPIRCLSGRKTISKAPVEDLFPKSPWELLFNWAQTSAIHHELLLLASAFRPEFGIPISYGVVISTDAGVSTYLWEALKGMYLSVYIATF
jgi:hypothetical protein